VLKWANGDFILVCFGFDIYFRPDYWQFFELLDLAVVYGRKRFVGPVLLPQVPPQTGMA